MIKARTYGKLPNGEAVMAYDFSTEAGFKATILSYGATLQSLIYPDGTDVTLGFDSLKDYLGEHPCFGSIIGRVANRIGGASFEIDNQRYELPKNEHDNNLHSGPIGFDRVNWMGEIDGNTLILRHASPDRHQGFPGELLTELRFTFEGSRLSLYIQASTDKPCPVNITYHPYFNLTDGGATPCIDHSLEIAADTHSKTDEFGIQTGEFCPVSSGVLDYTKGKHIHSDRILDDNFVFAFPDPEISKMKKMAKLTSHTTGRKIIVCSTHPCLQAYAGCFIPEMIGKNGATYGAKHGITLEPQGFPDAVHHSHFPSNILLPEQIYSRKISYTFRSGEVRA